MTADSMNPARRAALVHKYGLDLPPDPQNTVATTLLTAELLGTEMYNQRPGEMGVLWLFDYMQNQELAAIAARSYHELKSGMLAGTIAPLMSVVGAPDRDDTVFVWVVGSPRLTAVRATKRDVADFAASFLATWRTAVADMRAADCQLRLAQWCDDKIAYLPHHMGKYIVLIPSCDNCRQHTFQAATDGHTLAIMAAHEAAPAAGCNSTPAPTGRTGLVGALRADLRNVLRRLWIVWRCR
jgi:hypothetical protein